MQSKVPILPAVLGLHLLMMNSNQGGRITTPEFPSEMEVIDQALPVLEAQLAVLDNAGLSMASIHVNSAIEALRKEKLRLKAPPKS